MNHDNDMQHVKRIPDNIESVAALKVGDVVGSSIRVDTTEITRAIAARSSVGWTTVWAGPGATLWTICRIDDCAPVGELKRYAISPRDVAELCAACTLVAMPRVMHSEDPLGRDREQDDAGKYLWLHSEYVAYIPHEAVKE